MKLLDELEVLAKKAGSDKHSDWLAFCEAVQNPETILAIAEHVRELEQRVLVAEQGEKTFEDGFCSVRQDRDEWKQRAEAAEAELARINAAVPGKMVPIDGTGYPQAAGYNRCRDEFLRIIDGDKEHD